MRTLLSFYRWLQESTLRTSAGIAVLSLLFVTGLTLSHAASSYDVTNETTMFLDQSITKTQTTIVLASPQLNGSNFRFATTTGGVLRIRSGNFREDIWYTAASVNTTTNKVTLTGVMRNLCPQVTRAYVSCGDGRTWGKGATVELIQDARLFNLKVNLDRFNKLTASGAISFAGSGTFELPVYANATVRTQEDPSGNRGRLSCLIDTGLCYYFLGGTWNSLATGSFSNASDTVAGKVQMVTLTDFVNLTATGSTGAQNVLGTRWIIRNGSGAVSASRLVLTNKNGVFGMDVGGLGVRTELTGGVLVGQGSLPPTAIGPGAANNVLVSDGTRWASGSPPRDIDVLTGSIADSNTLSNPLSLQNFAQTGALTSTQLGTKGYMAHFFFAGGTTWVSGTYEVDLRIGGTSVFSCSVTPTGSSSWAYNLYLTVRKTGASGIIQVGGGGGYGGGAGFKGCQGTNTYTSFDTTTNKTVNVAAFFGTTNGGHTTVLSQLIIDSLTP